MISFHSFVPKSALTHCGLNVEWFCMWLICGWLNRLKNVFTNAVASIFSGSINNFMIPISCTAPPNSEIIKQMLEYNMLKKYSLDKLSGNSQIISNYKACSRCLKSDTCKSLVISGDRKIPTRGSNIPMGNKACQFPHWNSGPKGWNCFCLH